MSSDPFRHLQPGDPVSRIPAAGLNAAFDAARDHRRGQLSGDGTDAGRRPAVPRVEVLILNEIGDLDAGSVVRVGAAIVDPGDEPFEVRKRPVFQAETPTSHDDNIAILSEGAASGEIVRAVVLGVAVTTVDGGDWVSPVPGSTTGMVATIGGQARVLHRSSDGTAAVLLTGGLPLGCGLSIVDGEITLDYDLFGSGLEAPDPENPEDCKTLRVKADCHIQVTEDGVGVTPTTLIGDGLDIQADEENPCDKITVKPACHIQVTADGVGVTSTTLIGAGLENEVGESCDRLAVKPGCGITVSSGTGVSVDLDAIAGAGLQSNGAMPCPALEVDIADCSALEFIGGKLAVDVTQLAGAGLGIGTVEGCDSLQVNVGCGLEISEGGDTVRVKNTDLIGAGIEAGTGCSLQIDTDWLDDYLSDYLRDLSSTLKIKDCKLTVETTRPDGSVQESEPLDICCIVQQCIEPVTGAVCEAGPYCLIETETGARTCQELDCGDTAPEGYTIESGPHADMTECAKWCGAKWYCILEDGETTAACFEMAYGYYQTVARDVIEHRSDLPIPDGTHLYTAGYYTTAGEAWADVAAGGGSQPATIQDGPFDDQAECEATACETPPPPPPPPPCACITPPSTPAPDYTFTFDVYACATQTHSITIPSGGTTTVLVRANGTLNAGTCLQDRVCSIVEAQVFGQTLTCSRVVQASGPGTWDTWTPGTGPSVPRTWNVYSCEAYWVSITGTPGTYDFYLFRY